MVTDRYPAVILAMLTGTPIVPIDSNTFKMRGLTDVAEYPLKMLANNGHLENARRHINHALRHRAELVDAVCFGTENLAFLAATSMLALQVPTQSSHAYIFSYKSSDREA